MGSFFSGWSKQSPLELVTLPKIKEAKDRIASALPPTPLTLSTGVSELSGREIFFKWDNKFKTGSFKERGATNALLQLAEREQSRGVCAASAGNHAQALSFHARRLGIPCKLVMPVGAPLVKIERTRRNGADVILEGNTLDDAYQYATELARKEGLSFISPFDDAHIINGQGCCGLEIVEQLSAFDSIIVPIGGGGYISGIATALKALKPEIFVLGVQSEWAESGRLGQHQTGKLLAPSTIADGIAVKRTGRLTQPIIDARVDKVVSVSEQLIARAIVSLLEIEHAVVEGAGAAPLAALLAGHLPEKYRRTVVCISGSNIDMNVLQRLMERDMGERGRLLRVKVSVPDRPGSLNATAGILARAGANILEVIHDRTCSELPGNVDIMMVMEVRNPDHSREVVQELQRCGVQSKPY
ncbi:MAG: threonine ammonia-lyase [Oligoflexia bacterium]|nr:threonine ammonia-lyase [Oligoflexia bacterium]